MNKNKEKKTVGNSSTDLAKGSTSNVRQTAMDLLLRCAEADRYSNIALDSAIKRESFSHADKALLTRLVYGVTESLLTLDYYIGQLSSRPIKDIDRHSLTAIRLGLYQLMYLDRVPDHAAINESVALCPRRSRGFVNAVLREYTRRGGEICFPDESDEPIRRLSVKYSFSPELCEEFVSAFGYRRTESIFAAFCKTPPITLRVNTLKTDRESLISSLKAKGIEAERSWLDTALKTKNLSLTELDEFCEGSFFVQDEASQICTKALDAERGDLVLDICACPGSKSFGAAIDMENEGRIMAFDLHENKLSLVRSGAKRLGIDIIETSGHDGRDYISELEKKADRIICDVPCSGFGVIAKKPELRYKSVADCRSLPDIQLAILENSSRYLSVGGYLVYSTCTLLPSENELNIARFIERNPEFCRVDFSVGELSSENGMLTLFPDTHGTDGFFIAKLSRKQRQEAGK